MLLNHVNLKQILNQVQDDSPLEISDNIFRKFIATHFKKPIPQETFGCVFTTAFTKRLYNIVVCNSEFDEQGMQINL